MHKQTRRICVTAPTALFTTAIIGTTSIAGSPSGFSIIELDPPSMTSDIAASDFNDSGHIIGEALTDQWYGTALRISDGSVIDLHPEGDFTLSQAHDINSDGDVAVEALLPPFGDGAYTSYIYRYTDDAGLVHMDIQSMGGPFTQQGAQAQNIMLNDAGDLAGAWYAGVFGGGHRAFLYTEKDGWVDLGTLLPDNPSGESRFIDLNEQREVLLRKGDLSSYFVYSIDSNTMEQIDNLELMDDVEDMNDAGQITGQHSFNGDNSAFRYSPENGMLNLDPGNVFESSRGVRIAANGNVAGFMSGDFFHWTEKSGMQPLNIHLLNSEATPVQITAFNSHGQIGGTIGVPAYQIETFYWSPKTGPMLVQDLVDPDADVYDNANIAKIDDSGQILINAHRISDDTIVPLMLSPEPVIPGDINADGTVGVSDLLALLGAWGECNACPEDLNDSGSVDVADLLILLSNWG